MSLHRRRLKAAAEEQAPLTEERQEQWHALELPPGLAALHQLIEEKGGGPMLPALQLCHWQHFCSKAVEQSLQPPP